MPCYIPNLNKQLGIYQILHLIVLKDIPSFASALPLKRGKGVPHSLKWVFWPHDFKSIIHSGFFKSILLWNFVCFMHMHVTPLPLPLPVSLGLQLNGLCFSDIYLLLPSLPLLYLCCIALVPYVCLLYSSISSYKISDTSIPLSQMFIFLMKTSLSTACLRAPLSASLWELNMLYHHEVQRIQSVCF